MSQAAQRAVGAPSLVVLTGRLDGALGSLSCGWGAGNSSAYGREVELGGLNYSMILWSFLSLLMSTTTLPPKHDLQAL